MYNKQTKNVIKQGYNYISTVTNEYTNAHIYFNDIYSNETYIAYDLRCNISDIEEIKYKLFHSKYLSSFFVKGHLVIYYPRSKTFNYVKPKSIFHRIYKFFEYLNLQ